MNPRVAMGGFLLACMGIGYNSGCSTGPVPPQVSKPTAPAAKETAPAAKDLPVVAVTDAELSKEWGADEQATIKKYAGKRLEVSGTVWMATNNNATGLPMVMLEGSMEPKDPTSIYRKGIQCLFPEADMDKVSELAKGQKVKVRGVLGEHGACAGLPEATLLETGPSTAITATVDQLVADVKADLDEATKKYNGKSIRVEAPVADVKWDGKRVTFTLAGKSGAKLDAMCECDINDKLCPRLQAVKKGDTVKIQGEGQVIREIDLIFANLLK
jgi:tRNA_anti-like